MKFIKFEENYGDEFDIYGYCIASDDEYEKFMDSVKKKFEEDGELIRSFGTNEEIEWYDIEDYLSCLSISEITLEEAKVIGKILASAFFVKEENCFIKIGNFLKP